MKTFKEIKASAVEKLRKAPVLQATAWVGMVVNYSEAEGIGVGISNQRLSMESIPPVFVVV